MIVSTLQEMPNYQYRGARAMILMHERYMREFVSTWRRARARGPVLPQTEDPCYASMEALLQHILRAGRGYMVWMCEKLELPDPEINPPPELDRVAEEADAYLEHVLSRWRLPLAAISEERMSHPTYQSRWGMDYSIDAMMEHAVVHPARHTFQLEELMG
jgi:hypothetical protein